MQKNKMEGFTQELERLFKRNNLPKDYAIKGEKPSRPERIEVNPTYGWLLENSTHKINN
jgi:hypothetical protein